MWRIRIRRDRLARWVAWHLPRGVVMWCFFRVFSYATVGKYSDTKAGELTAIDAIGRWNEQLGYRPRRVR